MRRLEVDTSDFVPPCEGDGRALFESVYSFRSDETREAAIKCASCLIVRACRQDLGEIVNPAQLDLPAVRSGVYISSSGTRRVVDLYEGDHRVFQPGIDISYEQFIDSENPNAVIAGLRQLLINNKISIKGGTGDERKAALINLRPQPKKPEDRVRLRHFKALYQARSKGFLLGDPIGAYEQTVPIVLSDFEELRGVTDEPTAEATVTYFRLDDLSDLFSAANDDENIPDWFIKRFLHGNRREPQVALRRYQKDYERITASEISENIPATIVRRLVIENPSDPVGAVTAFSARLQELRSHVGENSAATPHTLSYIALYNSRSMLASLERFEKLYAGLMSSYGDQGLDPTSARLFALQFPNQAHAKAKKFVDDLQNLNVSYAHHPALDEGKIRQFARLNNSPSEAIATHIENVARLAAQYPDIPYKIICAISCKHLKSADKVAAEVNQVRSVLIKRYQDNPLVTAKVINGIAHRYRKNAVAEIETYLENMGSLQQKFGDFVDLSILSDVALDHPRRPGQAVWRLVTFLGISSLNKKVGFDIGSAERGDFIIGGISAEDEYIRIVSREELEARALAILDTLNNWYREQIEVYFGFRNSPDGSMPSDDDIDSILKTIKLKHLKT
jgi:hypothetical protein